MSGTCQETVIELCSVTHQYGKVRALDDVSLCLNRGTTVALIGPDGVGKSTLLSLIAGIKKLQRGSISLLGEVFSTQRAKDQLSSRIAFMPQGLGRNLYFSLSIYENIDFIARLFGVDASIREQKIEQLLLSTGLYEFKEKPVGQLSGGMKQKLSLCCALVHNPEILILDEPTTGVDPLSRRQFWSLIEKLRIFNPGMTLLVATAYMEEAERFEHLIGLFNGKILFDQSLEALLRSTGKQSVEEAFVHYLPDKYQAKEELVLTPFQKIPHEPPVMQAQNLTKKFGEFTAVNNVNFSIEKGEIFGFLGSNGCGKTTTMKMLTGLIKASSGSATLLGQPVNATDASTKMKIGYMSQLFSLYEELSVKENLRLHAKLYQMDPKTIEPMIHKALERFDLKDVAAVEPRNISLGMQQRLQLAAACLHQPQVLILDEPTSGVDPVARDMFWRYLVTLARQDHITIFISTHFMNEAQRCDRISLMDGGEVLAIGTSQELQKEIGAESLEEAFIQYLLRAHGQSSVEASVKISDVEKGNILQSSGKPPRLGRGLFAWFGLTFIFARREWKELIRDKIRISFTFLGPLLLLLCSVLCISFDVENIRFSVLDEDHSTLSHQLVQKFAGSRYFKQVSEIDSFQQLTPELRRRDIDLVINVPAHYAKALNDHSHPQVNFMVDGSQPFKASSIKEYISGIMLDYATEQAVTEDKLLGRHIPAFLEPRFMYNTEFKTIYSIVPGQLMLTIILVTIMLTALGIVRERENGSIINFYTSPAHVTQYLIGKQLPYVGLSFLSGSCLLYFSVVVLGVAYKGSLLALLLGLGLYLFATSGLGLLLSVFAKKELSVLFLSAIVTLIPASNFSGLIYPVSTLTGASYWIGNLFPASWFQQISVGVFNKGLGINDLLSQYGALFLFSVFFMGLACLFLRKEEK
ncbi:MAG: ribosome-associated ATPase/putative transporter RbbA [Neisseriaceae bacterium]